MFYRELRFGVTCFHPGLDLISLLMCKLSVGSHLCIFRLLEKDAPVVLRFAARIDWWNCTCELNSRLLYIAAGLTMFNSEGKLLLVDRRLVSPGVDGYQNPRIVGEP